jgi:hypothetical protein
MMESLVAIKGKFEAKGMVRINPQLQKIKATVDVFFKEGLSKTDITDWEAIPEKSELHQVFIGFSDLNEVCVGRSVFYKFHMM